MTVLYADSTKRVYILLSHTGTIFTKLIKLYTRVPYNHASLVFEKDLDAIYSFGRKKPMNPFIAGFVREDYTGIYGHFKNTTCALYELQVEDAAYKNIRKGIELFESNHKGYRYNLIGLLGIIINRPIKRNRAYFCSQFVYAVLEKNGVPLFDKPAELVTPKDFQEWTNLELIYQGKVLDYAPRLKRQVNPRSYRRQVSITVKTLFLKYAKVF